MGSADSWAALGAREVEVTRPFSSRGSQGFDRGWSTCLRIFREGWHLHGPVLGEGRAGRRFVFLPSSEACKQSKKSIYRCCQREAAWWRLRKQTA